MDECALLSKCPSYYTNILKKLRVSFADFFVLSTSNSCTLWKDVQIKLKNSEDISDIILSNFCENQLIPHGAILIVHQHFWPENTQLNFMF